MSDPTDIAVADGEHLVEPPMVDQLRLDEPNGLFVVTFIPQDEVSASEKEIVEIAMDSVDGRRVLVRMKELSKLAGGKLERLHHAGGGEFVFAVENRGTVTLSQLSHPWLDFYRHLQDIGMIAQIAFRDKQLARAGAA